jgi:hypothetical protein
MHLYGTEEDTCICMARRRIHASIWHGGGYMHLYGTEEDTCIYMARRRIHESIWQRLFPDSDKRLAGWYRLLEYAVSHRINGS